MNCHDARTELESLLPREAGSAALRTHLAKCASCRAAADRLAHADARLSAHFGRLAPRPEFDSRLRAAIARATTEKQGAHADRMDAIDPEPARRRLRAESILDGIAAVGVGATVIGLALHWHATLQSWLEIATSGHLGAVAASGTFVLGTVTVAAVGGIVAGAARWMHASRV